MALITSSSLLYSSKTGSAHIACPGIVRLSDMGEPNKFVVVYNDQTTSGAGSKMYARVLVWNPSESLALFSGSEYSSSLAAQTQGYYSPIWASGSRYVVVTNNGGAPCGQVFEVTASENTVTWISTSQVNLATYFYSAAGCSLGNGYMAICDFDFAAGSKMRVFEATSSVNISVKAVSGVAGVNGNYYWTVRVDNTSWVGIIGSSPSYLWRATYNPTTATITTQGVTLPGIGQNAGTFIPVEPYAVNSNVLLTVEGANVSTIPGNGVYMNYYRLDTSNTYQSMFTGAGTGGGGFQNKKAVSCLNGAGNFTNGAKLVLMNPAVGGNPNLQTFAVWGYMNTTSVFNKVLMNHVTKEMTLLGPYTTLPGPAVAPISPVGGYSLMTTVDDDDIFMLAYAKTNVHGLIVMKFNANTVPSSSFASTNKIQAREIRGVNNYLWTVNV